MRIHHNIPALNTNRNLSNTNNNISKNLEKLSSGYRINRAGDDAAGLAISEKMRAQITGLTQAKQNAEDGVSLVQTVEGAMTEVHSMLNRMISLSVQSANGTYTKSERMMMDQELQNLKSEITRISKSTNFNGTKLFTQADSNSNRIAEYNMTLDLTARTCTVNSVMFAGSASSGSTNGTSEANAALADKIATEYFPNAIAQIFGAFSSLEAAVGSDKIEMQLQIDNIDGSGNTLAYAQFSFYSASGSKPINMLIKVDSSDFSDSSIQDGSPDVEMLESTIAHELMHSVMQYTMTDEMSGRTGEKFPEWFTEGTAQLAGGGFPTNWNYGLEQIADQLSSATDNTKDADIAAYLKQYSVDGRPYGHGYLAAAYLGYLASGQSDVTGANIAAGMDKIFNEIINNGKTLDEAIAANTILADANALKALFTNAAAGDDLTNFIRSFAYAVTGGTADGAGSVLTKNLYDGGTSILGDTITDNQAFFVNKIVIVNDGLASSEAMQLMVGETGIDANSIQIKIFQMDNQSLNLENTDILTAEKSKAAINTVNAAIDKISSVRSYYGAIQNRLEHTINNLGSTTENLTAAESRIRDMDMAKGMMDFTRNQILLQSGQSMLAHANMVPQSVLTLLHA